jgi:hypothetical protein
MEYQNLFQYPNTYPSLNNYGKSLDGGITIVGKYEKDNALSYPKIDLTDVEVIENTTFRFIIGIKESEVLDDIRYFTSEDFYSDISAAIAESNPYFINNALNPNLFIYITLDKQLKIFNDLKLLEIGSGVKTNQNLFLVSDNTVDYITLVQYIDWVVGKVNPLDDDTSGVLPAEKIADYEIGEYNSETGEFRGLAEKAQELAKRLETLYLELEDVEEAISAMEGDIPAPPTKRKTSVLEIVSLGLGAVSVLKGVSAVKSLAAANKASKALRKSAETIATVQKSVPKITELNQAGMKALQSKVSQPGFTTALGQKLGTEVATKQIAKQAFNFKKITAGIKSAAKATTNFVGNKTKQVSGLINKAAGTQIGAATITTAIAASGVVASSKGNVQAKGAVVKNVLKEVRKTATIELGKAIVKKAITKGILKGATAKILGAATGPIGAGIMAAVGIVKFFVGKAKQKKEFKKQKEAYDKSMAEFNRLAKRKDEIEFEINSILKSGKLTLDGKVKGSEYSSTEKYFKNIGKNLSQPALG